MGDVVDNWFCYLSNFFNLRNTRLKGKQRVYHLCPVRVKELTLFQKCTAEQEANQLKMNKDKLITV